jgi:hypothetical protein
MASIAENINSFFLVSRFLNSFFHLTHFHSLSFFFGSHKLFKLFHPSGIVHLPINFVALIPANESKVGVIVIANLLAIVRLYGRFQAISFPVDMDYHVRTFSLSYTLNVIQGAGYLKHPSSFSNIYLLYYTAHDLARLHCFENKDHIILIISDLLKPELLIKRDSLFDILDSQDN